MKERLNEFWNGLEPSMQTKLIELASTDQGHKIMYALLETEAAKRGEPLDVIDLTRKTDMAIGFILSK